MEESIRFYTPVCGMELADLRQIAEPTSGEVVGLKNPGSEQLLELNRYREGTRFGPSHKSGDDLDHLGFDVDDLDEVLRKLEGKGVKVTIRPGEIGVGAKRSCSTPTESESNFSRGNEGTSLVRTNEGKPRIPSRW